MYLMMIRIGCCHRICKKRIRCRNIAKRQTWFHHHHFHGSTFVLLLFLLIQSIFYDIAPKLQRHDNTGNTQLRFVLGFASQTKKKHNVNHLHFSRTKYDDIIYLHTIKSWLFRVVPSTTSHCLLTSNSQSTVSKQQNIQQRTCVRLFIASSASQDDTKSAEGNDLVENVEQLASEDATNQQQGDDGNEVNNNNNNNNNNTHIPMDAFDSTEPAKTTTTNVEKSVRPATPVLPIWPCGDELDKRLFRIVVPVMANNAINPAMGAVDFFWVSQMGNPLAIAGQASANQVMNSIFWLITFLPNVSATLISKANAANNQEGVEEAICQALFLGIVLAILPTIYLLIKPDQILATVLPMGVNGVVSPAFQYAKPCLFVRAFAFIPSTISLIGFSAFRGILDTVTPVKISLFANAFNAILDPILIFSLAMGVPGAALATLVAEIISAGLYLTFLRKRKLIRFTKIFRFPSWSKLQPLVKGGAALQLRNIALNLTFLSVARVTNAIDTTGVAAAAHALTMHTFQLGGIALFALSIAAQTVVPNDMMERYDPKTKRTVGGIQVAKNSINRLMCWGFILGTILGAVQLILLPIIQKSTPIQEIRDAATIPAILCSCYQMINGLVFIGEGVMVGTGSFLQLSLSTVIATIGCLWALQAFPPIYGLTGVWMGFGVFNLFRLLGVWIHQNITGPLTPKKLNQHARIVQAKAP